MTTWLDREDVVGRVAAGELHRLSPTLINDADVCLRRAAYRLTSPRTTGEARVCGTGYHAGLEHYYRARHVAEEGEGDGAWGPGVEGWPAPPDEVMLACYEAAHVAIVREVEYSEPFEWDTSLDETSARAQHMLHAYFSQGAFWPAEYRILGVEIGYAVQWNDFGERGVLDLVVYNRENGQTIIDDHKTANKKWKAGKESTRATAQPAMYDQGWESATGVKPDAMSFSVMTYDGKFERRMVQVTDRDRQLVETKRRTFLPLIAEHLETGRELPGNTTSFLCSEKWCDYWAQCDLGGATS